jgi:hypothetical protein
MVLSTSPHKSVDSFLAAEYVLFDSVPIPNVSVPETDIARNRGGAQAKRRRKKPALDNRLDSR